MKWYRRSWYGDRIIKFSSEMLIKLHDDTATRCAAWFGLSRAPSTRAPTSLSSTVLTVRTDQPCCDAGDTVLISNHRLNIKSAHPAHLVQHELCNICFAPCNYDAGLNGENWCLCFNLEKVVHMWSDHLATFIIKYNFSEIYVHIKGVRIYIFWSSTMRWKAV